MHARFERLILLVGLLALLVPLGCSSEPGNGGGGGQCVIEEPGEAFPGAPFKLELFASQIIPALKADCAECHDDGKPNHDSFTIFSATAEQGNCDYVNTFKEVKANSDLVTPDNSPIVRAMQGAVTNHPIYDQAKIDVFLNFIKDANLTCVAGGGCLPTNGIGFDRTVFETQIQPAMDRASGPAGVGCSVATSACHAPPTGTNGFVVNPNPIGGSQEMTDNFNAITNGRVNLANPETSLFYIQATTSHGAGQSSVVSAQDGAAILAWIKAAQATPPPATGCADTATFNVGVWSTEVRPMLEGRIDWNDAQGQPTGAMCGNGQCHGNPQRPFNLVGTDEEALQKFACYVNAASPIQSPVFACPQNQPACPVSGGHPGGTVWPNADDENLRVLLRFVFASYLQKSPLDFGAYTALVEPIFNDENAVASIANTTCASAGCHKVLVAGGVPDNLSQFGLLENAGDPARLAINYAQAANFVNFANVDISSLLLYPEDECQNTAQCIGTLHGGGDCFADDSQFAANIRKWGAGVRPNANAKQTDWFVTGDFPGNQADTDFIGIATVRPKVFDRSGGAKLAGEYTFFSSQAEEVDVGTFLGGVNGATTAYAFAYYLNTTGRTIRLELTIDTENEAQVYFNGRLAGQSQAGGGQVTAITDIPPFSQQSELTLVAIQLFKDAADQKLAFTATLADDGVRITDASGLVIMSSTNGGI